MKDLKFRILEIKKNPDVTTITAECVEDGVGVTASVPTLCAYDRPFIRAALVEGYTRATQNCVVKVGDII